MDTSKHAFEATEGLLRDVITKQAGSIEKAVLEAVMNSVDAGASEIDIELTEDTLSISDDGSGMVKEDIQKYFKKFGLKDDDIEDKEFGKFRMGRGQIFSFGENIWHTKDNVLVINIREDESVVTVEGTEHTLDTSDLQYHIIGADESVNGCSIEVSLYEDIDDVPDTVEEIRDLIRYIPWLHNVDVEINNDPLEAEFEYDIEKETCYISFDTSRYSSRTKIYNKGAYVKKESLLATSCTVVTKDDLDLNFARNDILSGCPVYARVREELNEAYTTYLKQKEEFTTEETNWILINVEGTAKQRSILRDKPAIKLGTGERVSISEISDCSVTLSDGSQNLDKDIMRRTGVVPISKDHQDLFTQEGIFEKKENYSDVVSSQMKFEMDPYDENKISKKRKKNLILLRWVMSELRTGVSVEVGVAKHRDVWMTDRSTLYIDKDHLNANKTTFATEVLLDVVREAGFKSDTRTDVSESYTYYRRVDGYLDVLPELQQKIISGAKECTEYVKHRL